MPRRHPGADPPIVINGRAAVRREIGGVERLAREMALRLPALRPDRYRVIAPPPALAHRAGHAWEQCALPALAARAAVLYSPANLAPVLHPRNVVVIHDAAALIHPEAYSAAYVAYQRRILPAIVGRARLIITVSEFSRGELVAALGAVAARTVVIPPGVDERFSPAADAATATARHGLSRPYVLAVGTASARKNPEALAAVAAALAERRIDLVVAGSGRGYLRDATQADAARADAAPQAIRRLGYVPEDDLPGLYAGAQALVLPSLHEGFGLPCLEAMASGIPVVAARAGALPETTAGAALLADPRAPGELAEAVVAAATDDRLRARLIDAGHERARNFSWTRTVDMTDEVLQALL